MSGIHQAVATGKAAGSAAPTPDILWWQFTDGSGTTVTATVGPNGTLAGGATWVTGHSGSGYAIQCDGTDDSIYSASNVTIGSDICTVTAWVYWDSFADNNELLWELGTSVAAIDNTFHLNPNAASGIAAGYVEGWITGTNYFAEHYARWSAATWTHIAVIYDNNSLTGVIDLYVNGASATAVGNRLTAKNSTANFVAAVFNVFSRNNASLFGAGRIDDLRIYSYALDAGEISAVYAESY